MALLDDVLAANSAVVEGSDVPVPAVPAGKRVVVVACSEILSTSGRDLASRLGFTHDEALVVANAGARVTSVDGDVVRSVATAFAAQQGGEVFVVAHENCEFQEADPDAVAALLAGANSSMLSAIATMCGESYVSARKLAVASAETLRRSPFLPRGTPVHALVFDEGRGRLSVEQRGYDFAGVPASTAMFGGTGLGAPPSPILAAPGPSGFGAPGPVALFGSGPSSLMGLAPPPSLSPAPDLGGGGASLVVPPPMPPTPAPAAASVPPPLPPPAPLSFKDPAPPPSKPSAHADDPFKKAAETLERLRRARRK